MADKCFTAQTATTQSIVAKIGQLSLQRNDNGQYMHVAITQLKKGIQRVLEQQYSPAGEANGMLDLLIAWAKYKYSYTRDNATLKDILLELDKEDLVRTPKDASVPGTANAVTTMLKKRRTMGNYDSSKENDKEDGWNLVTRGVHHK